GPITDYTWDFGDGSTFDGSNTFDGGTSPTTTHTYARGGPYTVTLTVTNKFGQTATATQTVTADIAPTASLNPSATVTTPGSPVSFDASGSSPGADGTIADYEWDFGDGPPAEHTATPNDNHTYADPGHYTATLTVTDDLGTPDTTTESITVDAP